MSNIIVDGVFLPPQYFATRKFVQLARATACCSTRARDGTMKIAILLPPTASLCRESWFRIISAATNVLPEPVGSTINAFDVPTSSTILSWYRLSCIIVPDIRFLREVGRRLLNFYLQIFSSLFMQLLEFFLRLCRARPRIDKRFIYPWSCRRRGRN
mmetsp:Transcript_22173/g.31762  ORF Transcript_22173/g.31762 Transcript_22173/m.31762 type:complete len:157 (+) Transcript_22173:2322-2792(+)